jgi:hypothetical protein
VVLYPTFQAQAMTFGTQYEARNGQRIETFMEGGQYYNGILESINAAKRADNAHFEGIIFHQGESNNEEQSWLNNVKTLYEQMKAAMGIDYDIPFIAGELLYSGSCAGHNELVHRVPDQGDNFYYISAEGLTVDPSDTQWGLHFGHEAQVELGKRYAAKMIEALGW